MRTTHQLNFCKNFYFVNIPSSQDRSDCMFCSLKNSNILIKITLRNGTSILSSTEKVLVNILEEGNFLILYLFPQCCKQMVHLPHQDNSNPHHMSYSIKYTNHWDSKTLWTCNFYLSIKTKINQYYNFLYDYKLKWIL